METKLQLLQLGILRKNLTGKHARWNDLLQYRSYIITDIILSGVTAKSFIVSYSMRVGGLI